MVVCTALLEAGAVMQQLDRILAVAAGHIILASDVRAFIELGLIEVDATANDEGERERRALTRLIERRLALDEVDRYRVAPPLPQRIDRELVAIRGRFPDEMAFIDLLAAVGLTLPDLRQILRDDTRLEVYLFERFGSADRLSESELRAYFAANRDEFTDAGRGVEFETVREQVQARLWAEMRTSVVADWMAGLARRGQVTRFDQ